MDVPDLSDALAPCRDALPGEGDSPPHATARRIGKRGLVIAKPRNLLERLLRKGTKPRLVGVSLVLELNRNARPLGQGADGIERAGTNAHRLNLYVKTAMSGLAI